MEVCDGSGSDIRLATNNTTVFVHFLSAPAMHYCSIALVFRWLLTTDRSRIVVFVEINTYSLNLSLSSRKAVGGSL